MKTLAFIFLLGISAFLIMNPFCLIEADCNHEGEYKIFRRASSFFQRSESWYTPSYKWQNQQCIVLDNEDIICGNELEVTYIK